MDMNGITAENSISSACNNPYDYSKTNIVTALNKIDYSCCPSDNYNAPI